MSVSQYRGATRAAMYSWTKLTAVVGDVSHYCKSACLQSRPRVIDVPSELVIFVLWRVASMFYKLVHCFGVFVGAFREQLVQKFALLAWDRLRRMHTASHPLKAGDARHITVSSN